MALVRVMSPESSSEIAAVVAMLEAYDIPCFVHNAGLGGMLPGVQINACNTRSIMVPEEKADEAIELIRDFQAQPSELAADNAPRSSGKFRNLIELLLFGWFVPGRTARRPASDSRTDDDSAQSTGRE